MNLKSFGYVCHTFALLNRINGNLGLKLGGKFLTNGFHVYVVLVFQRSRLTTGGVFGEYYKQSRYFSIQEGHRGY
jgi:hypothetical protein